MPVKPLDTAPRVSCTIIAFNEADRIGRAIRSVEGLVDEVVVVDSGSTDGTPSLARRLGARVIERAWPGYGPQKRFAEDQAVNDWILNLDADEWLSEALRQELTTLLARPIPQTRSFWMRVRLVYPNREAPAPFAPYTNCLRLYNRRATRYADSLAHDSVPPTADAVQLKHDVWHKSFRNVAQAMVKTLGYYQLQKVEQKRLGPARYLRLVFEFPFQFFKYYFVRGHVFGGADGFVYASALAMGRWARIFVLMGW